MTDKASESHESRDDGNPRYELEAEGFLSELDEQYYLNGAGLQEKLELSPIYKKYRHLFSRGVVEDLLGGRETKAGRYLAHFAAFQYLGGSAGALTEQIAEAETAAVVEWDGRSVPYRQAWVLVGGEADRARRLELHERILAVLERQNQRRLARLEQLHGEAKSLGFGDYVRFCDDLTGFNLDRLAAEMTVLLAETKACWQEELARALEDKGVPSGEADVADLRHVLVAPEFDSRFPKAQLIPSLTQTLAGLGIDMATQPNLHLDIEERPLKSPRAFCSPIRVPGDVRLVIMPQGGQDDYSTLFHEAGHAQHFVNTDASAPFPYRCLGDNSVTESYAFVFNLVLQSRDWAEYVSGIDWCPEYARFSRFRQLHYLRRYAAKLCYERELHASEALGSDLSGRYAEVLGGALGVRIAPAAYLSDVDDGFYCACYLRGWMLEVHLRRALVDRFGRRWFASSEAGDFLKGLWALGQELTAEELAQRLGYSGLDADLLIADLIAPPEA